MISLNSYEGKIEVFNSLFNKNLVFFPSAAFSNAPRFEDKVFNPLLTPWFRQGKGSELENQYRFEMSSYNTKLNHTI